MTLRWFALMAAFVAGCDKVDLRAMKKSFSAPPFVQVIEVRNLRLEIRLLPRILQVIGKAGFNDSMKLSKSTLDSLLRQAGPTGTLFMLKITPRDTSKPQDIANDILYGSIAGFDGYRETLEAYQHGFLEGIWIEFLGKKVPVSQIHMENTFGLTQGRTFFLVFPDLLQLTRGKNMPLDLVLDEIVPGLSRKKIQWTLPEGKNDESI